MVCCDFILISFNFFSISQLQCGKLCCTVWALIITKFIYLLVTMNSIIFILSLGFVVAVNNHEAGEDYYFIIAFTLENMIQVRAKKRKMQRSKHFLYGSISLSID